MIRPGGFKLPGFFIYILTANDKKHIQRELIILSFMKNAYSLVKTRIQLVKTSNRQHVKINFTIKACA